MCLSRIILKLSVFGGDMKDIRADFEKWFASHHSWAVLAESDWDEKRSCYKNHANHLAWKAYQAVVESKDKEIANLKDIMLEVKSDLLMRGKKDHDGVVVVGLSQSRWVALCEAVEGGLDER